MTVSFVADSDLGNEAEPRSPTSVDVGSVQLGVGLYAEMSQSNKDTVETKLYVWLSPERRDGK